MTQHACAYRAVLRELRKTSARSTNNKTLTTSFRKVLEKCQQVQDPVVFEYDIQHAIAFMCSQRQYQALLDKYNPLVDLTAEQRIHATARRVGLDMPVIHKRKDE